MTLEDGPTREDSAREAVPKPEDRTGPLVPPGVFPPNEKALAVLKAMRERRKDRGFSKPDDSTLRYLREARAGGMYGDESPVLDD